MLAAASAGAMYNKDSSADTVALDRPLSPATPSPPQFRKAPTFSAWAAPSPLPGFSASSNTFFTGGADDDAAYAQRFIKHLLGRLDGLTACPSSVRAAWLLMHLSRSPANTTALLSAGTLGVLVRVLAALPPPWDVATPMSSRRVSCEGSDDGTASEDSASQRGGGGVEEMLVECVAGTLANLAQQDFACRGDMAEAGVVLALVALLPEGSDCMAVEHAVSVLHSLAATTPALRDAIREAGAIPELVTVLYEAPQALNLVLTRSVLWTLISLAEQSPANQRVIWNAGACQALAPLLTGRCFLNAVIRDTSAVQGLAARCMHVLAQGSSDSEFGVSRAGIVPHLVHLLEDNAHLLAATGEETLLRWRAGVAAMLGQWVLLLQAHRAVAASVDGLARPAETDEEAWLAERAELKTNVWTAWREVAVELMMRLLPASRNRLHPAREALRALRAVMSASPSGLAAAGRAEAVPVLLRSLAVQVNVGKDLAAMALEPAELIAMMVVEDTDAQDEVRLAGGVELLVRMLPSVPGDGAVRGAGGDEGAGAPEDDMIRFWWDRIMWGDDQQHVAEDFPFNAGKVLTSALDALMDGNLANAEAAREAGATRPLLQLLHAAMCCRRYSTAIAAVSALASLLDGHSEAQREFLCERGVAALIMLLRLPRDSVLLNYQDWLCLQAKAAECVQHLVEDFETAQHRVRQVGAIPCLLLLLEELLPSAAAAVVAEGERAAGRAQAMPEGAAELAAIQAEALAAALWAVNNLVAHNAENQEAVRRALGLPLLVQLLQTVRGGPALCAAMWVVAQLAAGAAAVQDELGERGVVDALMAAARREPPGDGPLQEGACRAIGALATGNPTLQDLLRGGAAMELLLELLQCGPDTVTAECAAQALAALCWNHPANQTLMGDSGGLAMLVDQLSLGPHSLLARGASLALAAAMGNNFRNQNIVRDARGAYVLVGMLRSGPHNPVVVPTLHALALLVHGHRAAQSEVGEAGGCGALLRLLRGATQQEGDGGQEVVTEAMVALARLLADHPGNKAALLREGGLPDLLGVIRCGCQALSSRGAALPGAWDEPSTTGAMHPSVRASALLPLQLSAAESAGQALGALANGNTGVQSRVREVGGVAMLIQLLGLAIKAREHWPEGRTWLNAAAMEAAGALAALSGGHRENQAEVRNHGGLEALVWGLKLSDDEGLAVEETACVLRCITSLNPAHFWDAAMESISELPGERGQCLQDCVRHYFRSEGTPLLQLRALQTLLTENPEKPARTQYMWALMQLAADSDEVRAELREMYDAGIAPLKHRLDEIKRLDQRRAPGLLRRGLAERVQGLMSWCASSPPARKLRGGAGDLASAAARPGTA